MYDRLIQEAVLALAKPSAEKIYMGKPLGKHDSRQDEIHELLVRKAREGKTVIRLKVAIPFFSAAAAKKSSTWPSTACPLRSCLASLRACRRRRGCRSP